MILKNHSLIRVYFNKRNEKILVGKLALKNRQLFFEYSQEFIETGLELSPFKLPLKKGLHQCQEPLFDGLFGVFNDSLPDGWGRLLLDRKLSSIGINPMQLSPLDRLSYVGNKGMGALSYEPIDQQHLEVKHKDLDQIAKEATIYQEREEEKYLDDLLAMNGSSAGARPKALISVGSDDWIIKFRSSIDPKDIGPIEWAYHLMAKKSGLLLPLAKLFPSKKGGGFFGVKRFDRIKKERVHMHTLSGLLHADHRFPSLDYQSIMKATAWLTKDIRECEKQFRAIAFNIFSHNRDDHAKNFSFLMENDGSWHVSPAYDLTFSSGPAGEHCTTILGEGKNPKESHLLKLAEKEGIKNQTACKIIEEVKEGIACWSQIAKNSGVSSPSIQMIQKALNQIVIPFRKNKVQN